MYGLSDKSYNSLLSILASVPEIEEAILYGSRARGDYWKASDIDLSLKGESLTKRHIRLLNDKFYLSIIPYFFDICIFNDIKNDEFRNNILRDGIVIYRRKELQND